VCYHDVANPLVESGVHDGDDLVAVEVAGGEHEPMPRDSCQDDPQLLEDMPALVDDGDGIDGDPLLASSR